MSFKIMRHAILPYIVLISMVKRCQSIEIASLYRPQPGTGYWTSEDEIQAHSAP